jgi:hypothetical protein
MGKRTHNMSGTPVYGSWASAKARCTTVTNDRYSSYGGRGITMCERWLNSFENFYEDMGQRPEGTSLDRIDCNGNYEPSNCRWATYKEQSNNQRIHVEKGYSVAGLAEETGISYGMLHTRLQRGWSVEEALSKDNTKENVELLQRNNTSGVRGVSWDSKNNKWTASFTVKRKCHFLGRFTTIEKAEAAIRAARAALL